MCGIIGEFRFDYKKIHQTGFQTKLDLLKHRGPDENGFHIDKEIAIGHTRLSIIDLESSHAKQPKINENIILTYNGEIYNFKDLSKNYLGKDDYTSDTDCLFQLINNFGNQYLAKLSGMFAFGWYCLKTKKLFLYRDPFGIKPLYYHVNSNRLIFSSEIKPILADHEYEVDVDNESLTSHLMLGHSLENKTLFKDIFSVEPGILYSFDMNGKIEKETLVDLSKFQSKKSLSNLDQLISSSIKSHSISDVPIGLMLSGGLDSNLILTYLHQNNQVNDSFESFTAGELNSGEQNLTEEISHALNASKNLKFKLNQIPVEYQDFISIKKFIEINEEPICNPSGLLIELITRKAKEKGIKVLMSGHGADEIFGGYRRYLASRYFFILKKLQFITKPFIKKSNSLLRINRFLEKNGSLFELAAIGSQGYFQQGLMNKSKITPEMVEKITLIYNESGINNLSTLKQSMYLDIINYLQKQNLVNMDKMSMYNSTEVRVPFLNQEIFNFGFTLVDSNLIRFFKGKNILRKLFNLKSSLYLKSNKTGFGPSLNSILKNNECIELLTGTRTQSRKIFDIQNIKKIIDKPRLSQPEIMQLLNLAFIEQWFRIFIDEQ